MVSLRRLFAAKNTINPNNSRGCRKSRLRALHITSVCDQCLWFLGRVGRKTYFTCIKGLNKYCAVFIISIRILVHLLSNFYSYIVLYYIFFYFSIFIIIVSFTLVLVRLEIKKNNWIFYYYILLSIYLRSFVIVGSKYIFS